jgi:hypothetical protein
MRPGFLWTIDTHQTIVEDRRRSIILLVRGNTKRNDAIFMNATICLTTIPNRLALRSCLHLNIVTSHRNRDRGVAFVSASLGGVFCSVRQGSLRAGQDLVQQQPLLLAWVSRYLVMDKLSVNKIHGQLDSTMAADASLTAATLLRPRGYQNEMFESSMKENVLVAVSSIAPMRWLGSRPTNISDGHRKRQDTHVCSIPIVDASNTGFQSIAANQGRDRSLLSREGNRFEQSSQITLTRLSSSGFSRQRWPCVDSSTSL